MWHLIFILNFIRFRHNGKTFVILYHAHIHSFIHSIDSNKDVFFLGDSNIEAEKWNTHTNTNNPCMNKMCPLPMLSWPNSCQQDNFELNK